MAPTLDNPGNIVTRPTKLAHVVLRTANFEKQKAFYKTFLGTDGAVFENDFLSFLTFDSEHHRIALISMPALSPKNPSTSGLEHIAFTYASLHDLALAYLQRKNLGIEPFWCVNHGPTTSLYYKDRDGNVLENQVENFGSVEAVAEYMVSKDYEINPIGVDFEMGELVQKLKRGEDEQALKRRPESGPRGIDSVPE